MSIKWDQTGEKKYESGVDHGVLYPYNNGYNTAVAWNGLTAVNESPSGAEPQPFYADNIKYANLLSAEDYGCSIEAYTYPKQFEACDGSKEIAPGVTVGQQNRETFGFSYRTRIGNDTDGAEAGYKLHLVYGCLAAPSDKNHESINENVELQTMSWEVSSTPVAVTGAKPTACLTIDSTEVGAGKMADIEAVLYGCDAFDASKTYAVGAYVSHEETSGGDTVTKIYKCNTAISTPAAWAASKWTEVTTPAGPRLPYPDEVATIMAATV